MNERADMDNWTLSTPDSNGSQKEGGPSQYRLSASGIRSPARSETNQNSYKDLDYFVV